MNEAGTLSPLSVTLKEKKKAAWREGFPLQ